MWEVCDTWRAPGHSYSTKIQNAPACRPRVQQQLNAASLVYSASAVATGSLCSPAYDSYEDINKKYGTVSASDVHAISMLALGGDMFTGIDRLMKWAAVKHQSVSG